MFELFNLKTISRGAFVRPPQQRFIFDRIDTDLAKTQEWLSDNNFSVNSRHILIRLLQSIDVPRNINVVNLIRLVKSRVASLSRSLYISDSSYTGKPYKPGFFYGRNVEEYYILNTTPSIDEKDIPRLWRNLKPVRIIYHESNSVDYLSLLGKSERSGIAVIEINPIDLALMYYYYRNKYNAELRTFVPHAIYNAIEEDQNVSILNRYFDTFIGDRSLTKRPEIQVQTYVRHNNDYVDEMILRAAKNISKPMLFMDYLKQMLIDRNINGFDMVKLPNVAKTRQIEWLLFLARSRYMLGLLMLDDISNGKMNLQDKNALRIYLRDIRSSKMLELGTTGVTRKELYSTVEKMKLFL